MRYFLSPSVLFFSCFIIIVSFPLSGFGQYSVTICQDNTTALIGTDRNDFVHNPANGIIPSEGYLHNFDPPTFPCGIVNPVLTSLDINIDIVSITGSGMCTNFPVFGNVLLNCPLTTTSICPIVQDVLTSGCNFGSGATSAGMYSLDVLTCGVSNNASNIIGVDIIPAMDGSSGCPQIGTAITDGVVSVTYEICIDFTYNQDVPPDCANTIILPCDDNDPCTTNDFSIVDDCDNTIICTPCIGTPTPCGADDSCESIVPCDDGNPCTENDVETILLSDGTVCQPCAGNIIDCNNGSTLMESCDDGDACTINDMQVVLACDGSICEPCTGTPTDCADGETSTVPCDDGNAFTENDLEVILTCDGSVCVPCTGDQVAPNCDLGPFTTLPCDDEDPCTVNDIEIVLSFDNTVCEPCAGQLIQADDDAYELNSTDILTADVSENDDPENSTEVSYSILQNTEWGVLELTEEGLFTYQIITPVSETDAFTYEVCITNCPDLCVEADVEIAVTFLDLFIPDAITPNGDNLNDFWVIPGILNFPQSRITVVNRWGDIVFESIGYQNGWNGTAKDGKGLPEGTYYYQLSLSLTDERHYKGTLTIVR
ncbi:MAG: gliding motility-associated C-terminal domain-containing protein [Saprospiraceae bacterium]